MAQIARTSAVRAQRCVEETEGEVISSLMRRSTHRFTLGLNALRALHHQPFGRPTLSMRREASLQLPTLKAFVPAVSISK